MKIQLIGMFDKNLLYPLKLLEANEKFFEYLTNQVTVFQSYRLISQSVC